MRPRRPLCAWCGKHLSTAGGVWVDMETYAVGWCRRPCLDVDVIVSERFFEIEIDTLACDVAANIIDARGAGRVTRKT